MTISALLYHHVGPRVPDPRYASLSISTEQFERQIRWLARNGYVGIQPADWLVWCGGRGTLPPKAVLLTFDDGYADFPDHALPILQRWGFGAVVFVITKKIAATNSWDGAVLMSASQIRECSKLGIEFGAHSRTHQNLTLLSDARLRDELRGSREDLSAIIGAQVTSFAYPYGYSNEQVRARVRESFDLAFTCDEGVNERGMDPYLLRRTMVQPGDLLVDLACRVRWGWSPVSALRARVRVRSRLRSAMRYWRSQDT
jgi:peptidoglycan/xylan/chitin deacetylase (PgdA/CDA1 family)